MATVLILHWLIDVRIERIKWIFLRFFVALCYSSNWPAVENEFRKPSPWQPHWFWIWPGWMKLRNMQIFIGFGTNSIDGSDWNVIKFSAGGCFPAAIGCYRRPIRHLLLAVSRRTIRKSRSWFLSWVMVPLKSSAQFDFLLQTCIHQIRT